MAVTYSRRESFGIEQSIFRKSTRITRNIINTEEPVEEYLRNFHDKDSFLSIYNLNILEGIEESVDIYFDDIMEEMYIYSTPKKSFLKNGKIQSIKKGEFKVVLQDSYRGEPEN